VAAEVFRGRAERLAAVEHRVVAVEHRARAVTRQWVEPPAGAGNRAQAPVELRRVVRLVQAAQGRRALEAELARLRVAQVGRP
jgi:hypothetical protein